MLNRCVFSLDLKVACDELDCTSRGREFLTVGVKEQKDRLAKSDARGTVSSGRVDERHVGPAGICRVIRLLTYDGVAVVTTLYV